MTYGRTLSFLIRLCGCAFRCWATSFSYYSGPISPWRVTVTCLIYWHVHAKTLWRGDPVNNDVTYTVMCLPRNIMIGLALIPLKAVFYPQGEKAPYNKASKCIKLSFMERKQDAACYHSNMFYDMYHCNCFFFATRYATAPIRTLYDIIGLWKLETQYYVLRTLWQPIERWLTWTINSLLHWHDYVIFWS